MFISYQHRVCADAHDHDEHDIPHRACAISRLADPYSTRFLKASYGALTRARTLTLDDGWWEWSTVGAGRILVVVADERRSWSGSKPIAEACHGPYTPSMEVLREVARDTLSQLGASAAAEGRCGNFEDHPLLLMAGTFETARGMLATIRKLDQQGITPMILLLLSDDRQHMAVITTGLKERASPRAFQPNWRTVSPAGRYSVSAK